MPLFLLPVQPKTQAPLPALPPTLYLVTDQIPLLLIVVLPQEPGLVRREVHGALRREPELMGLKAPCTQKG